MSFQTLLIHTCSIQRKTLSTSGYEKVTSWSDVETGIACRKDSDNSAKIADGILRVNSDDDIFFFLPGVGIKRGDRIVYDGDNYDIIKINKLFDSSILHHLEVKARLTDHN